MQLLDGQHVASCHSARAKKQQVQEASKGGSWGNTSLSETGPEVFGPHCTRFTGYCKERKYLDSLPMAGIWSLQCNVFALSSVSLVPVPSHVCGKRHLGLPGSGLW